VTRSPSDERRARLQSALKDNLHRRKAQARAREAPEDTALTPPPEAEPEISPHSGPDQG